MGTCSYTWKERDSRKVGWIEKGCQEETWEGSNKFCIFHDPSPEKDVGLFKEKLEEQVKSETEKHNFVGYCFPANWDFSNKEFEIDADFREATFQDAYFWRATFQSAASFSGATFQGAASFSEAIFQDTASFSGATFQDAYFIGATFQDTAYFIEAIFQDTASFSGATFQDAYFIGATFQDTAYFIEAIFQGKLGFDVKNIKKLDLRYAEFLTRSYITTILEKTRFHRTFLDNVTFIDSKWPENYIIYEEKKMKDDDVDLTFKELETIYRDLKQNMQNHGNYDIAGEFYYREMEMRRKGTKTKKRLWLEIYRILAGYGEKPQLVVRNSFFVIFLAAILFFFWGVARVGAEVSPEEDLYIIDYSLHSLNFSTAMIKDFGYCLYYSVVTFTTLGYGDIHPLGYSHFLASAEALTGAFFMALFVVVFARKMMR